MEAILGWRVVDEGIELHVKWRGFESQDATWEPMARLHEDVPRKVEQFVRMHAAENPVLESALATFE